jgi:Fur family transcriptional regulator, ferric uptake regulator
MRDNLSLIAALEASGCRLTGPRRAVAEAIGAWEGHFTAADLVAASSLRERRIGRATIFRALDLFTELGGIERLDLPTGEHAYVRCEPRHHHHLICTRCGATGEMGACDLMLRITDQAEAESGFLVESHRLELFGICPACRPGAERRSPAGGNHQ